MLADERPAEIEMEGDLALELAKKHYLNPPKSIASLIVRNQQLTQENQSLKKTLQNE
jgi:hypothetical protein